MVSIMLRSLAIFVALAACACGESFVAESPASEAQTEAAKTEPLPVAPASDEPAASPETNASPAIPALAECIAETGAKQADVDPEDDPEVPFAKAAGQKLVVFFQNSNASARYFDMVKTGATTWSKSPCVDLQVVDKCPENSNCVTVRARKASEDDDDTDGEFEGDDHKGVRRGGTLTVFTKLMDQETDNGALATIVHEMGHAIGLVHRLDENDLMNADTDDETNPMPDAVDFSNLVVIYGTR